MILPSSALVGQLGLLDPQYKIRFLQDINTAKNWVIDELIATSQKSAAGISNKETEQNKHHLLSRDHQYSGIEVETHAHTWKCFE